MEEVKVKMKIKQLPRVFAGFLILLLTVLLLFPAVEVTGVNVTSNYTISISVGIAELTQIKITPNSLNWSNLNPGEKGVGQAILLENVGSTNISKIWINNSYPSEIPFGKQDFSKHDAGNYIVIKRNSSGEKWYFSNLVEYNESELIYLTLPSGTDTHGRFRDANHEYFWALVNDTTGGCTNGTFYIGVEPHNSTNDGTIDLSNCQANSLLVANPTGGCRSGDLTSGGNYGYADVTIGNYTAGEWWNYSIQVNMACTQVTFYKWNQDQAAAANTVNDAAFSESTIYPGGNLIFNVRADVPYGTPVGTKTGALTIHAQAIETA